MRRAIRLCVASISLVAMLPACAPTADKWSMEGSTVEARASAFASCRSTANARMASAPPASTYQQVPAAGGVIGILVGALVLGVAQGVAQGAASNAIVDSCMRDAGYAKLQPTVNADGYRREPGVPDVAADGRRPDTREVVKPSAAPSASPQTVPVNASTPMIPDADKSSKPQADCGASTGPRTSLMANQPPPEPCKAGRS